MPIYEFYCKACNTIYNFFSRTINTEKIPDCPRCRNIKLIRKMSRFASVSGRKEGGEGDETMPNFDETKLEKAMNILADKAGNINENDPRQAAMLMKKLSEATGVSMGAGMEEALRRMERGEDPEKIEEVQRPRRPRARHLHPLGSIPASILFGALIVGANKLQRVMQVPTAFITALNGLVVIFVVSSEYWRRRWARHREIEPIEKTPGTAEAEGAT